jgi:hypothetical protein
MPVWRTPLYQRSDGADEDRWRLAFDTDAKRLFIEYEWKRGYAGGAGFSSGTDERGIAEFLNEPGQEEAGQERGSPSRAYATAEGAFRGAPRGPRTAGSGPLT